ncbi:MAG: hypothetical protein HPY66_2561 [Firmicutes bacterium]|nr:hypothetical protein [Bacillota bacterium]
MSVDVVYKSWRNICNILFVAKSLEFQLKLLKVKGLYNPDCDAVQKCKKICASR